MRHSDAYKQLQFLIKVQHMKSLIFIIVQAFFACISDSTSAKNEIFVVAKTPAKVIPGATARPVLDDITAMKNTAKSFLLWYRANYREANKFKFTSTDKNGNYQVNDAECKAFLKFLHSSSFVSDIYVTTWQKYFDDKARNFKQFPQAQGAPEGFDNDLVLMTQEPKTIFKALDKMKFAVTEHTSKTGIVKILGEWGYDIEMSKKDGKWKIDYIATMNYD